MKKIHKKPNPRLGSAFNDWLEEEGISREVEERSARRALSLQLAQAMERQGLSQMELARRMKTSRAVVQRVLDSNNSGLTFKTAQKATAALGLQMVVRLEKLGRRQELAAL
jgi:ribosome-binding protein aMBF1 (putative translation factor)